MKRLIVTMILLLMAFSLSACSEQETGHQEQDRLERSEEQQTEEPYSSDYDECLDRAAEEEARDDRPELVNHVENMEKYDVIFLGFPNWWYTVPMAVHSFLEEYDFAGKTVIPFCTHGTGGLASTIQDIKKDLPDSTELRKPIGVYRPDVDSAQESINEWLAGMGYEKKD